MLDSIPQELHDQFLQLLEKGDEHAVKDFLIEHIKEFPENLQKEIVAGLIEDALEDAADTAEAAVSFKEEGIKELESLSRSKEELERKLKISEIQNELS